MGTAAYNRCAELIAAGRIQGMVERLDALLSFERITVEEYMTLMTKLQTAQ